MIQVVGLDREVRDAFRHFEIVAISVSQAGLARLLARLRPLVPAAGRPTRRGRGLYEPSLFYEGLGRFSYRNVCNHWTADLLNAAGLPVAPVAATLPAGLIRDLEHRPERWLPAFGKRRCEDKKLAHRPGSGFRDDALAWRSGLKPLPPP